MSWFKKYNKVSQDRPSVEHNISQEVMFYNPDPLVNRLSMALRLSREIEFCLDEEAKEYLKIAMEILLKSIEDRGSLPSTMH